LIDNDKLREKTHKTVQKCTSEGETGPRDKIKTTEGRCAKEKEGGGNKKEGGKTCTKKEI
jgi:hypothetical protein